jgi:mRNA interferase MazF
MTVYKRGDIVLCADGRGDYTSKPRPVVIVQNSDYLAGLESVTICPLTSVLSAASVRVRIKANTATGLKEPSDVEVDKITTVRVARLTTKIGVIAEKELDKINHAMRVWLDL